MKLAAGGKVLILRTFQKVGFWWVVNFLYLLLIVKFTSALSVFNSLKSNAIKIFAKLPIFALYGKFFCFQIFISHGTIIESTFDYIYIIAQIFELVNSF